MNYRTPTNLKRSIVLINDIYNLYLNAKKNYNYKIFASGKGNSGDASHRLRLVHDVFLQDAFKNDCIGTIYRTSGMLKLSDINKQIHCEHVIPNNILIKYIYFNLEPKSLFELAKFIFENRVICGVSKDEKYLINKYREIGGQHSRWTSNHPNFKFVEEKISISESTFLEVKPFLRYINTGLDVYNIFQINAPIDFHNFSMRDHYRLTYESQSDLKLKFEEELINFESKT